MSILTKVFALLVSVLSIFLCGVVVTFIAKTQYWKELYDQQKTLTEAAQIKAMAVDKTASETMARNQKVVQDLRNNIQKVQELNSRLNQDIITARQNSADKENLATTAVDTMNALEQMIANMYSNQLALQNALDQDRKEMLAAKTRMIELTRKYHSLEAENNQLNTKLRQQTEKIYALEDENTNLRQKLDQVTLASNEFIPGEDVGLISPADPSGVPIRGQVTMTRDEKVAISVGSASGVRKGMTFWITRGTEFLGNLKIIHVEPQESVGMLDIQKGVIVAGDEVTTGFDY